MNTHTHDFYIVKFIIIKIIFSRNKDFVFSKTIVTIVTVAPCIKMGTHTHERWREDGNIMSLNSLGVVPPPLYLQTHEKIHNFTVDI